MVEMYWLTRICALNDLAVLVLVFSLVALPVFVIGTAIGYFDDNKEMLSIATKGFKYSAWVYCISVLLATFIPDKKELMIIIGGGAIYDYVQNSEEVKKLPDNVVKALNDWLAEDKEE